MNNAIACTEVKFDLTKSHASRRIFFVAQDWFDSVPRLVSKGNPNAETKIHGKWTFVLQPEWEDGRIMEFPWLNWIMRTMFREPHDDPRLADKRKPNALEKLV